MILPIIITLFSSSTYHPTHAVTSFTPRKPPAPPLGPLPAPQCGQHLAFPSDPSILYDIVNDTSSTTSNPSFASAMLLPRLGNWDLLYINVTMNSDLDNNFALGALQGYMLADRISALVANVKQLRVQSVLPQTMARLVTWYEAVKIKAALASASDVFWSRIRLVLARFDGLVATATLCGDGITMEDLILLQFDGDVGDVEQMVLATPTDQQSSLLSTLITTKLGGETLAQRISNQLTNGHQRANHNDHDMWHDVQSTSKCSALVRMLPNGDVIFAHTTWAPYVEMIRIFMHVELGRSNHISYSGYAGMLASTDDWYQNSHGLAVMETSLNIIDAQSYARLEGIIWQTVPGWLRTIVAAEWSTSAQEFINTITTEISFTYNAQYMILDKNHQGQKTGVLTVLETIPNTAAYGDLTSLLQSQGFFSSQNTPMFSETRAAGFYPDSVMQRSTGMCEQCNCLYSYDDNPRGCIFKRDAPHTTVIQDVASLMWSNQYKTDPLSRGLPQNAVAGRYDLVPEGDHLKRPFGGIDAKVSSFSTFGRTLLKASGPVVNDECPPFLGWTDSQQQQQIDLTEIGWVEV